MRKRLHYLIDEDDFTKIIVLKGEPGTGKTHFLNELKDEKKENTDTSNTRDVDQKYSCHSGLDQVDKWLDDPSRKVKLLLLDEANTHDPELLHLLKAIKKNRPVFFRGKFYPPEKYENAKVVCAVNPEWYNGRHYHELLQFYGETVQVKMPDKEYLLNYLISHQVSNQIAELALVGAELYKKYEPLMSYSMRDLQSLMQRYHALKNVVPRLDRGIHTKKKLLFEALCGEFALRIEESAKQRSFRRDLIAHFKVG